MSSELLNNLSLVTENPQKSEQVLHNLANSYAQLIGLDFEGKILPALKDYSFWEADYLKDSKWGLSLMDAYRCLLDTHRTLQIMGGINETIKDLEAQGKKDIVAIDAGTGTGIFAIYLAALGCKKVYALELNEETAEVARKFIDACGCSDIVEVRVGDATEMNIPELTENPADILISENLSNGLLAEPQFQIINHLSSFLKPDAPIIPYSANISVALANGDWGRVDWKDKKPRNILTSRRVPGLTMLSERVSHSTVISSVGMEVPRINGEVQVPITGESLPNTLLISTDFQINNHGAIYTLQHDSAEFLGKTSAVKLEGTVALENGVVKVLLDYDAGFSMKAKGRGADVVDSSVIIRQS